MPTTLRLNCREDIVFPVTVGDVEVGDLKNEIKKQCAVSFEGVDSRHLELWKVSAIDDPLCEMTPLFSAQGLQPNTLVKRLEDDLSKFADQLDAVDSVFGIFPTQGPVSPLCL
ncbi:hypothetical protein F5887DRAFT_1091837 [Amanita rubescens]|nr:hypothetical protein F5887DRAFT_1091837 [Amanita rubescens]